MSICSSTTETCITSDADVSKQIEKTDVAGKMMTTTLKAAPKLIADFSVPEKDISHYIGITLWLGWMQFYPMMTVLGPILWMYEYKIILSLILAAIVTSAITSIRHENQPEFAFKFGDWVIKKSANYLGLRVYHEDVKALNDTGKCIFMIEPHDVLPVGICGFHDKILGLDKSVIGCLSSACFAVPLMRHMYTWLRCGNVNKKSLVKALKEDHSIVICPGGAQEVTYMKKNTEIILYIKSRFGLVKLALETGTPMVPSFCFGQRQTYSFWVPQHTGLQKMCRQFGFIPVFFFGYFGIPFAPPKPAELVLVTGSVIRVPQIETPTKADLEKYQEVLIKELERIFEENKSLHGMGDCSLKII